eukprot:scaffold49653_cov31-Tisochrysis_lutea.AAC.3
MHPRPVPKRANVDAWDFRCRDDSTDIPHERPIHTHKVLGGHSVSLIEDYPDLLVVALDEFHDVFEFVGKIKLVGVKEQ